MVAPVFPALTMASARPSRTASAQRTSDESFLRRTLLAGSSSMATTSPAWRNSTLPGRGAAVEPVEQRAHDRLLPDEEDGDARLGRQQGAGHDLARGPVAAHGVDRHQRRPGGPGPSPQARRRAALRRPRPPSAPRSPGRRSAGLGHSTSRAWRPPYHPQLEQTMWGSLVWWQWGQSDLAGAEMRAKPMPAAAGSWPWGSSSWGRPSGLLNSCQFGSGRCSESSGMTRARRASQRGSGIRSRSCRGHRCG